MASNKSTGAETNGILLPNIPVILNMYRLLTSTFIGTHFDSTLLWMMLSKSEWDGREGDEEEGVVK